MKFNIPPIHSDLKNSIQHKIDTKTKPLGSLGQLESLALDIALIQGSQKINIIKPTMLVFAADHGIAAQGISIAPSEVTSQMVSNFLNGGAAINCFCRSTGMELKVIDAGIKNELPDSKKLLKQRLGAGTKDFSTEPAMQLAVAEEGIKLGADIVEKQFDNGCNTVGFGEMGIGNTSSASAIMAALLQMDAEQCVGTGTGINEEQLLRKTILINSALQRHKNELHSPLSILATLGGYEIAQITGGILQAAEHKMLILIDGFITTVAALLAVKLYPLSRHYMVFCHHSEEQGHQRLLQELTATPVLGLGLRLGEGTGAALALPIIEAVCTFYNEMASFEEAGVTV